MNYFYIIHGDDIAASRQYLFQLKQQLSSQYQPLQLEGKQVALEQIRQAVESSSLFGQTKLLIIENLHSQPASKRSKQLLSYLASKQDHPIILWEKKTLTPAQLKPFKKAQVKKFNLPVLIFKFLDQFGQPRPQPAIKLTQQAVQHHPPELLFSLLIKRVRQILILLTADAQTLKSVDRLADWQIKKIQQQSRVRPAQYWLDLHQKLLDYDHARKTSQPGLDLGQLFIHWWLE